MRRQVLTLGLTLGAIAAAGVVSAAPAQASCVTDFYSGVPRQFTGPTDPSPVQVNGTVISVNYAAVVPFTVGWVGPVSGFALAEGEYAVSGGQAFVTCV